MLISFMIGNNGNSLLYTFFSQTGVISDISLIKKRNKSLDSLFSSHQWRIFGSHSLLDVLHHHRQVGRTYLLDNPAPFL